MDQTTGAVYVSTTGHPERYVAVSHDKARTWGRVEALDCEGAPAPNPSHNVTCNTYPESGERQYCGRVRCPCGWVHLERRTWTYLPVRDLRDHY